MKMEKMIALEWIGVLWNVHIHQHLKAKQSKNRRKSKRHGRENRTTGKTRATTAVGLTTAWPWQPPRPVVSTTGWLWWPLWWLPGCFPPCAVFWSFGVSPWAAGFAFSWVFWASLQAYFDPHGPHFISWIHLKHFSPNLGLNHRNLQ